MIPVIIAIKFERPPGVSIRAWRQGMKAAHEAQALTWHREMLPDHFKAWARHKYRYQSRKAEYRSNKEGATRGFGRYRRKGVEPPGTIDLVFTGDMRDMLVNQTPAVKAFPTRARLDYRAPEYLVQRVNRRKSNQPDKWAEITRVTPDQLRKLEDVLKNEVLKRFEYAQVQPFEIRLSA